MLKIPKTVPKKYRGEPESLLERESKVLESLPKACRLVTPHFYGAYKWPGGQALAFSYGGTSLADLDQKFSVLSLFERCAP